jgi:hypothetical protein
MGKDTHKKKKRERKMKLRKTGENQGENAKGAKKRR